MLKEFVSEIEPKLLGQVVHTVFDKMKLAGDAGALLRIEEEIREVVEAAKTQWVRESTQAIDRKGQPLLFTQSDMDRLAGKPEQVVLFDLSGLTDDQFFERAEHHVAEALRLYAEKANSGHRFQKRLFADDAARGFAFIELCQRRFDVILMNPPFGDAVPSTKRLLGRWYPAGKRDMYAAFVEMAASRIKNGKVGVLSSRTGFFLPLLETWRKKFLLGDVGLDAAADLGLGVLDEALVEAAAYVVTDTTNAAPVFVSELASSDKELGLRKDIRARNFDIRFISSLRELPLSVISYWVGPAVARLFKEYGCLEGTWGASRVGLQTSDDFRFIRLFWEVAIDSIGRDAIWVPLAKGGEYQLFWDDIHLLVKWENDAEEMKDYARSHGEAIGSTPGISALREFEFYFKGGLTYPERTTSEFSPRILPDGCITGTVGPGVHIEKIDAKLYLLAWLTTRLVRQLIEINIGLGDAVESGSAARHYNVRMVGRLPVPDVDVESRQRIVALISEIALLQAKPLRYDETTRQFHAPFEVGFSSFRDYAKDLQNEADERILGILQNHWAIEQQFFAKMHMPTSAREELTSTIGVHPWSIESRPVSSAPELGRQLSLPIERLVDEIGRTLGYARQITK